MLGSVRPHAAFALFSLLTACGPTTTTVVVAPKPVPPPPKPAVKVAESPARWVLLPNGSVTADARFVIEGVGTLYVGRSGDRWLEKKGGGLAAAETLVPQAVRGVLRDESGRYAFVGAEGDVYFAKEPLGPIVETRAAKSKVSSVAVGKRALVGLSAGVLVRSVDLGLTWAPVATPKIAGTLSQVAMLGEEGLLLVAPQRVLATEDDGASWQPVATPGVGARRVVADANGELVLEGLTASALLRRSPLRLEKVSRAPTAGWDLPATEQQGAMFGSEAVFSGTGALVGDRYVEAVQDAEHPEHWKLSIAELGKAAVTRAVPALEKCDRVFVTGQEQTLVVACTNPQTTPGPKSKWGPPMSYTSTLIRFFRSTDLGVTFKDDGMATGADREKLMWLGPDGTLVLDGACKRTHNDWECSESPPLVRPPGGKLFAKAVSAQGQRFDRVVFGPNGTAFALGLDVTGRLALFVSKNGGRDFVRKPIVPVLDEKGDAHQVSGTGAVGVDETGVYVLVRNDHGRLMRYAAALDGSGLKGQLLDLDIDAWDLHGRRGFAFDTSGAGFETADGGATWTRVGAPTISSSVPLDRFVACSAYGCLIADRATRVGWELPLGAVGKVAGPPPPKKTLGRTPLKCSSDGEWKALPGVSAASTANADLGGTSRWIVPQRDAQKNGLHALLGSINAKGALEVKDVTLLGPASADTAAAITMQVEGVAAMRYSFKRDKIATPVVPTPPTLKKPPPGSKVMPVPPPIPSKVPAITAKQSVDVEIAWYVAATGKVHHATIKNVGPLDPVRDVYDAREQASQARYNLLSIAAGGIHVRPFASMGPDAPLYWVTESGKVEKLTWPEVPTRDVRGRNLPIRLDAARVGGRSVVFGDVGPGLQLFVAWANANGSAWESRAWGLWPEPEQSTDLYLRFVESSDKPVVGVLAKNKAGATGWAFPLPASVQSDPDGAQPLPTLPVTGDPPKACGKDAGPWRMLTPWAPGTRHPVIVSSEGKELLLATSSAILRTGPNGAASCVSTLDAQSITLPSYKGPNEWYSAVIDPADLGHASLFRSGYKPGTTTNELTVRPMSCTFAPGPAPEAFATVPGFAE